MAMPHIAIYGEQSAAILLGLMIYIPRKKCNNGLSHIKDFGIHQG